MPVWTYTALSIFIFLVWPAFAQAQVTPSTSDLFDISQGAQVIVAPPVHFSSVITNMFGGIGGSNSSSRGTTTDSTVFSDGFPAGHMHRVEWRTTTPIQLEQIALLASHQAGDARSFSRLTLSVREPNGTFREFHTVEPASPYGGGAGGNELHHSANIGGVTGQHFRVEVTQRLQGSAPRVIELDGFGEALPALIIPENPVADDLWDVSQATTVTEHSGSFDRTSSDARNMFGYEMGLSGEEKNTVFEGNLPQDTVHWVEWRTPDPISLEHFNLYAYHDTHRPANCGCPFRDAKYHGIRTFRLFAKDSGGEWRQLHEYTATNPYFSDDGRPVRRPDLLFLHGADITPTRAQEFRAEFVQFGDPSELTHPDASGPRIVELDGFGDVVAEPDPVVIVPGMLASISPVGTFSEQLSNFWIFTPGAHGYYKSLLEQFLASGYRENEKVFVAHYNWRKPVNESATEYLKPMIDRVKQETGSDKVDIVAHSMGGLVARSYIQGSSYENDVDQLITLGTPHQGAADAYIAWEGGDLPITWDSTIRGLVKFIDFTLRKSTGPDVPTPLSFRIFFPALKDLLPITNFVTKNGTSMSVTSLTEQNDSLQNLQARIDELENRGVDVTAIVGTNVQTLGAIDVTGSRTAVDAALQRWRDGHPSQDPILPNSSAGDQRVLAASAQIGNDIITLSGGNHEKLPHLARKKILEMLGIESEEFQYEPPDIQSLLGITILSPIDPQITCGSQVLSQTQNTFADAQYIVDPNAPDAPKLLLIGNPPQGQCEIELTGTASGEYHAITCFADGDQDVCTLREGTTSPGKVETYTVSLTADSFQPPVDDVVTLLHKLKETTHKLLVDKHLKPRAQRLQGLAASLADHGAEYGTAIETFGLTSPEAEELYQKVQADFALFASELETQIQKGNLDTSAILELTSLHDQLKDMGL